MDIQLTKKRNNDYKFNQPNIIITPTDETNFTASKNSINENKTYVNGTKKVNGRKKIFKKHFLISAVLLIILLFFVIANIILYTFNTSKNVNTNLPKYINFSTTTKPMTNISDVIEKNTIVPVFHEDITTNAPEELSTSLKEFIDLDTDHDSVKPTVPDKDYEQTTTEPPLDTTTTEPQFTEPTTTTEDDPPFPDMVYQDTTIGQDSGSGDYNDDAL